MATPQQQRAQTLRELEQGRHSSKRKRLSELRAQLKEAQLRRRERLAHVRALCELTAKRFARSAKARRAALEQELEAEREANTAHCQLATARARRVADADIGRLQGSVREERTTQRAERIWTRPKALEAVPSGGRGSIARRRAEEQSESDETVERDIPDDLLPVWRKVRSRIKATARKSRTEAFLEWMHEHQGEVYRLLEADADAHERHLAQQEAEAAAELHEASERIDPELDPADWARAHEPVGDDDAPF